MANNKTPEDRSGREPGAKQTRLEDIARQAGVSIATVSRALNDSNRIRPETKARIQALADAANYGIRKHGRAYSSPSRYTIALVLPQPHGQASRISEAFFLDLIGGIGDALKEQQCDLLISHQSPSDHQSLLDLFTQLNADGVIFVGQSDFHEQLNDLAATETPFVVWGAQLDNQRYPLVGSDNFLGGRRLTEHLLRLGRRQIVFLGDPQGPEMRLRYEGYVEAMEEADLKPRPPVQSSFNAEAAAEHVASLVADGPSIDAIVAGNDIAAIGAMRAIKAAGMWVPHDISVVGYDDVRVAAYAMPALTTIRQDVSAAGRYLVAKILQRLQGQQVQPSIMPPELIVRESCGA